MSIASQFNAAKDFADALLAMNNDNPTVRAVASSKAEEAFQRLVKARSETGESDPVPTTPAVFRPRHGFDVTTGRPV